MSRLVFTNGDIEQGCATNSINNPPYLPRVRGGALHEATICADAVDSYSTHYNTHSLYGWFESEPTYAAVKEAVGKRTFCFVPIHLLGNWKVGDPLAW